MLYRVKGGLFGILNTYGAVSPYCNLFVKDSML
jgi:hypothetical protein